MKTYSRSALLLLLALSFLGCRPKIIEGGEDIEILQDRSEKIETLVSAKQLLPLEVGNYWEMNVATARKSIRERVEVVGPIQVGKETGVEVKILRGGQLWRLEVYQNGDEGLRLLAFGQNQANLLVLQPPFSISRAVVQEGESLSWKGIIRFQGKSLPATGYSRVTLKDNLTTRMGRLQAYRLDSVLTMSRPEGPLHFPNVRWLTSGIGFIRRGYADDGSPVLSEMERYRTVGVKP